LTWHRMNSATLDMLWQFERDWVKKHTPEIETQPPTLETIPPMLFRDYFQMFFVPLIRASQNRSDWDNLSDSLTYDDSSRAQYAHFSFDACRAACDLRESCVQYAWEPNKCRLGNVVRLGDAVNNDKRMKSGWLPQRVEKFGLSVGNCKDIDAWMMPTYAPPEIKKQDPPKEVKKEGHEAGHKDEKKDEKKEDEKKDEKNSEKKKEEHAKEEGKAESSKEGDRALEQLGVKIIS
jgi:hypothetical protein